MMRPFTREKRLRTRSVAGTLALGEMMTELLRAAAGGKGRVVVLRGDLGAGKTTLVKGMAAALGAATPEEVTSPTFTLVHEYEGKTVRLFHLDLYRLETEHEVEGLGIWEMAEAPDAFVIVEWGDKFPGVMERADAEITIERAEIQTPENETERLLLVRWRE